MEMFRPTRDGGTTVRLSAGEATLLRTLATAVLDLLGPAPAAAASAAAAGTVAAESESADLFAALEKEFAGPASASPGEPPQLPDDPVLARLLPDAYQEDPEAAAEFRKYTESSLREAKKYFAQSLLDTLPPDGGRIRLTAEQSRDWMRALNDVRLMFGIRLEISEEFEEQLAGLDPGDPRIPAFEVYGWLGAVQESLVHALARR